MVWELTKILLTARHHINCKNDSRYDKNSQKKFLFEIAFEKGQLCCSEQQGIKGGYPTLVSVPLSPI